MPSRVTNPIDDLIRFYRDDGLDQWADKIEARIEKTKDTLLSHWDWMDSRYWEVLQTVPQKIHLQWLAHLYAIDDESSRNGWIRGPDLAIRWGCQLRDLLDDLDEIPIYLLRDDGNFESIGVNVCRHKELLFNSASQPASHFNIYILSPSIWWFRQTDVEFFEKLYPEVAPALCQSGGLSPRWLTGPEVLERWPQGYNTDLRSLVRTGGLKAHKLDIAKGSVTADDVDFAAGRYLFKLQDIQTYEQANSAALGLTRYIHWRHDYDGKRVIYYDHPTIRFGEAIEKYLGERTPRTTTGKLDWQDSAVQKVVRHWKGLPSDGKGSTSHKHKM